MRALIVVDVQQDFCEGGSLPVTGGHRVAELITGFVYMAKPFFTTVVASADWHDVDSDNSGHLAEAPDYVDTWPAHCIAQSPGAQFQLPWDVIYANHVVCKGQGKPAYSAFEGVTAAGLSLNELLERERVQEVYVCGLATDYCVKATALDSVKHLFSTTLIRDLTAAVGGRDALDDAVSDLVHSGVRITRAFEVLEEMALG